jgi:hypothetical protein
VLYLKHVKGYSQVWRLENVPDDVLAGLALKRPDVGIDIICEKGGKYTAVQCKYKKHVSHKKNVVTWKQLSTFYALVLRWLLGEVHRHDELRLHPPHGTQDVEGLVDPSAPIPGNIQGAVDEDV